MPNFVIRKSNTCWDFGSFSVCPVTIKNKDTKDLEKASFIVNGRAVKIKKIKKCWEGKDGNIYCIVNTKGKNGKNKIAIVDFENIDF